MNIIWSRLIGPLSLCLLGACASTSPVAVKVGAEPAAAGASAAGAGLRAAPGVPGSPGTATEQAMESARRSVRSTAEWLASGVDSWFGDKPFKDGGKVTDGQFSVGLLKRQGEGVNVKVRFNARFRLPNVEEKTYLFIGRDNQREVITDKPGAFSRQQRLLAERAADRTFFAGIGRTFTDSIDFRLGMRSGLKPYVQGRYRRPWTLGPDDSVELRQTLFWSLDDHLGSTTALSYEHAFSPTLAARWLSAATITQTDSKFEWHTSVGAYKLLSRQRLLSLELVATGKQGSGVPVLDYGVQTRWEQLVYKDWLFGDVIVGHFWPRPDAASARGRAWALGGGLRMRF